MISDTTKILLVEDNPGDARLIREMLAEAGGNSFEIEWVLQLSAGVKKLRQGEIDLVLLDLNLPDSRGLDTFVKAYAHAPQIPFVVLTGLNDEILALTAVREGAQDYLVKGQTDGGLLLRAIRYATERKKVEGELRRANDALRREIEERRAAEMAVEAERQRLYALLDRLPAIVSLIAPDFSILFANQVFTETFGNWNGRHCYEVIFGRKEVCDGCMANEVMERRTSAMKEMAVPRNGQVFSIYNYPFTDVDGTTLVLSLGIDVTQRKEAEEALEAERQRLYALLDGLPALVYLKAPDYSLRFANRKFRDIYGDWRGKRCFEALFGRQEPCEGCTSLSVINTGEPSMKEVVYPKGNRTYQVFSYPFVDVDGSSLMLTLAIDISERKEAEEALKESEGKYRLLVSTIPAVVFKGYADWSVEFFDNKIEAITGYSKEEFDSRQVLWRDIIPLEDLSYVEEIFREALKTNRSYIREHRIRRKDGEIRWVQCRGKIFCDAEGKVQYIHGVTFDITDRRAAEEALRQSEARLAKAQRLAHLGHWEWDPQSNEMAWSEELLRIYGVGPGNFVSSLEAALNHIHPEDEEKVRRRIEEVLAGGRSFSVVYRVIRPDGSVRYVHSQAEAVFDESGKLRRLLGTAQDITERRTAERRLRDSEERFRAIFESAAMGIGLTNMEGRFLTTNKTFQEMLGYSEEEMRGKTCSRLTHEEDLERSREFFRKLESGREDHCQTEKRFRRKDGQYIWARVTASLVKDAEGQPLYTIGMVEDITQARQAEERLQESEMRLRYLASQLLTAQEDERNRISRELHDELGQALLVLKLQTRSIEKELKPDQEELRAECLEILGNLDHVVDNVRRLSQDLSPMMLEDLGLSAGLQRLIRGFSKHYQIKYSAQETDINDLFPPETQVAIYRIVQESLTNIGKHSQAKQLVVAIKKSADGVSFLIQDNGQGFDPAQSRRHGRGMGLAAMEERVRMVGGSLSIWSRKGAGTKISFEIPYSAKPK